MDSSVRLVSLTQLLTLKIRAELKAGMGETGQAPITICVENKWQVWTTYCRAIEIMIWHFGLNRVPDSQMPWECVMSVDTVCIMCICRGVSYFCRS